MKHEKLTALAAALALALPLTACSKSSDSSESKSLTDKLFAKDSLAENFKAAESRGTTKLADIVGEGLYPQYAPAPDIEVNAVLADISQNDYKTLINDLKHCVDMFRSINGNNESSFDNDIRLSRTADNYGDTIYYYATNYNNTDELFEDARNCFSESFISTDNLFDNMFNGNFPTFLSVDGQVAWSFYPPSPSGKYDLDNAGVVMYSGTEAEVWVAGSLPLEATFYVEIFRMVRYDPYDNWKIDKMWSSNDGGIDNRWENGFIIIN